MSDRLVRGTAHNGDVRVLGVISTELVSEAVKIHKTTPTASAALGRLLTAGTLMGSMLKNKKDKISLKMDGQGPANGLVVTSYSDSTVKGYIGNPNVDIPLNDKGKLDVGGAIGKDGELLVIRDMGLKEPYVGRVPIYTGEVAEDIAYYYTVSEQVPSAVSLGVLVDKDLSIKASGGFIIQMMPGADEMLADVIMYRLEEIPPITTLISQGKNIEEILEYIFEDMDLKLLECSIPKYTCDCSREKVEKALISIGEKELNTIIQDNKTEDIRCQFCGKSYKFEPDDIKKLLKK